MNYLGDFKEDASVVLFFTTHDKEGGAIAPSSAFEAADVAIYKGSSAVQKATANGLTMTSPFDGIVGLHQLVIDTSNDTGDLLFWTTAAEYFVVLNPDETVDGEVVLKVIGSFSIERNNGALAYGIANGAKIDIIDGVVDALALAIAALPGVNDIIDEPVEGAITLREVMRVILAYAAGKASGGGTASVKFRDQADSLNRITMTVDSSGNRSATVLDLS